MTDTVHTPTPWVLEGIDDDTCSCDYGCSFFIGSNLEGIVGASLPNPNEINNHNFSRVEANAAHIVKCVNEAEAKDKRIAELEAALHFYADASKYPAPLTGGMGALWIDCGETARTAIAKAGEA